LLHALAAQKMRQVRKPRCCCAAVNPVIHAKRSELLGLNNRVAGQNRNSCSSAFACAGLANL
jgi:hypothetical protein